MMEKKPRTPRSFIPTPRTPRFVFDKDSTKDFGGMVIDRKVTIDAINNPSGRARKQRPSFGNAPKKEVPAKPKFGGRGGMGNKEARANKSNRGPGGPGASMKKVAKKRPPFIVDTFKG